MKTINIAKLMEEIKKLGLKEKELIAIGDILDYLEKKKAEPEPYCANCKYSGEDNEGYYYCDKFKWAMISDFYCKFHNWRKEK